MELLDMLYEMIDDAKGGLGGQCKIERDKALDILDEVRGRFPAEISEARKMMETRSEFMENAKADAERFRKQAEADADQLGKRAEDQARHMINEHEITAAARIQANEKVRQAEMKSKELVTTAERRANELKSVANEYCEDALRRTEEAVAEALNEVRQSRSKFRSLAGLSNVSRANKTAYDVAEEE
jgi:vacuolar-type H+-ATPase subunit H